MKIKITGRKIDVSDKLRDYAEKRISKLEKYFQQLIDTHLILSVEKIDHTAELVMNGDAVQFHAREKAADLYSAIDLLVDKMETQVTRYKDKIQSRKGFGVDNSFSFDIKSDQGREALLNQVSNKPFDSIEAFLQMKVDKSEFILFKKGVGQVDSDVDYANKNYAVIYKAGNSFRLLEIPFEKISSDDLGCESFVEYDLNVINDSASSPEIEFKQRGSCAIERLTLDEAIEVIDKNGDKFIPFFNSESRYFNVISRKGKDLEIFVPAF